MATGVDINTNTLSDETFDKLCKMCKSKNKKREAENFCIDCQQSYCSQCVKVHEDVPFLNDHEIIGKNIFSSSSTSILPTAPTEHCNRHKHKHLDLYCENHDIVGCSTCMAVDHGSCQRRIYISEYIQKDVTTDAIEQKLKLIAKSFEENQKYFQHYKQQLLEEKSKILEDIKRFRKEINAKLDELDRTILHEVPFDALIKEAGKEIDLLQTSMEIVKSALNKFGSSCRSASQKFVNYKKGKQIIERVDEQLEDLSQYKQNITVEFKPNKEIQAIIETQQCFGEVSQNNDQCSLLQTSRMIEQSVRLATDDAKCEIVSACVVDEGTIILSDRRNSNLKRLDDSVLNVMEHFQLAEQPWQVCKVRRKEVAVCLSDIKTVEFISIENKMTKSEELKTDFRCYGIAYNSATLYISDARTSVYVYNLSGVKLKQNDKDIYGNKLFQDIRSLAVSRSKIYVTDYNKGVILLDKEDGSGGIVDGPQIQSASGCSLTTRGNLLVQGSSSEMCISTQHMGNLLVQSSTLLQHLYQHLTLA